MTYHMVGDTKKIKQKIQMRLAEARDVGRIVQIATQVQEIITKYRSRFFGKLGEFRKTRNFYLKALHKKDQAIYVAEVKRKVVGYAYAVVERTPDDVIAIPYVSFDELAVDKRYQGYGVGRRLINAVHRWAADNKIKVVQLAVWEFNPSAMKLYAKMRYKSIMRKMEKLLQ